MSKGSPRVTLRLAGDLLPSIHQAIEETNLWRPGEPYDVTAWILQAVREKLAKLKRGRAPRSRKRLLLLAEATPDVPAADQVAVLPGNPPRQD